MVAPSQIDQILANLCVNARDSIADVGKITIEMGNSVIDEGYCAHKAGFVPDEYVRLVAATMDAVWTGKRWHTSLPFFTTKDAGEGTGQGLSTVYGAVKQKHPKRMHQLLFGNSTPINAYRTACGGGAMAVDRFSVKEKPESKIVTDSGKRRAAARQATNSNPAPFC
jgi:hypothetical protein